MEIAIKRVYEKADPGDGYRVLVDRLWPRGMKKEDAMLDEWLKEIAPSTELRKWFHNHMDKFSEFSRLYLDELKEHEDLLMKLKEIAGKKKMTLLYASKIQEKNHAQIIRDYLLQ